VLRANATRESHTSVGGARLTQNRILAKQRKDGIDLKEQREVKLKENREAGIKGISKPYKASDAKTKKFPAAQ